MGHVLTIVVTQPEDDMVDLPIVLKKNSSTRAMATPLSTMATPLLAVSRQIGIEVRP